MRARPNSPAVWRERILLVSVCALAGWFYCWTARSSSDAWNFGTEQTDYYNLLIDGWLDGQLHLKVEVPEALRRATDPYDPAKRPPGALHDASFYHGKYYLYFGAAPVVTLMLPFRVLTGVDLPLPAAVLMFAFGGFLIGAWVWLRIRRDYFPETASWIVALGVVALGPVSMALVLVRRESIWELPLASGYFFAMTALAAIYAALHASVRPLRWLALGSLALGLAVASRPTYLFAGGLLLVPVLVHWREAGWSRRARWLGAAAIPLALIGVGLAVHNYARFGNPLEFGTAYMLGGANEAKARYFSGSYFGYNVVRYFLRPAEWIRYFPFLQQPALGRVPDGYYGVEEVCGALPGMLVLWFAPCSLLAITGRAAAARRQLGPWLLAVALLALGPLIMLCCFWAAMARYEVDFLPALSLLGGVGVLAISRWACGRAKTTRRLLHAAIAGTLVVSAGFGVLQSIALYGNLRRLNPSTYARLACIANYPTHLWECVAGTPRGPIEMEVKFAHRADGTREPLVSTGLPSAEDRIVVVHETGAIRLACVHDGGLTRLSPPMALDPARTYRVRIEMGSLYPPEEHPFFAAMVRSRRIALARWWRIAVDGQVLLEHYQRFHPASVATLRIGAQVPPRAGEMRFNGEIRSLRRVEPPPMKSHGAGNIASAPDDFAAVRMTLAFAARPSGTREPLLSVGDTGRADIVFVDYLDGGRIRLGFDHWGKPSRFSDAVNLAAGRTHVVEIALGSFERGGAVRREASAPVRMSLDGAPFWQFTTKLFPIEPADVFVGENPLGATSTAPAFSGKILGVEWLSKPATALP